MNDLRKRSIIVLVLTGIMAGGGWLLRTTESHAVSTSEYATNIATKVGKWRCAAEWPPTEDEVDILGTRDIVHRSYRTPDGHECYLSVVRSTNERTGVHDPLVCLTAQGWQAMEKRAIELQHPEGGAIPAMEVLIAHKGGRERLTIFFYKTGPYFASGYWRQQAQVLWSQLFRDASHSSLIRMDTALEQNKEAARKRLHAFAANVMPEILEHIP